MLGNVCPLHIYVASYLNEKLKQQNLSDFETLSFHYSRWSPHSSSLAVIFCIFFSSVPSILFILFIRSLSFTLYLSFCVYFLFIIVQLSITWKKTSKVDISYKCQIESVRPFHCVCKCCFFFCSFAPVLFFSSILKTENCQSHCWCGCCCCWCLWTLNTEHILFHEWKWCIYMTLQWHRIESNQIYLYIKLYNWVCVFKKFPEEILLHSFCLF